MVPTRPRLKSACLLLPLLLAVAGCNTTRNAPESAVLGTPSQTRNLPGPGYSGGTQPLYDPGIRPAQR